ncbi:hypothetical protein Ancab_012890 [Ancistrocladus abbreviatus]
MQAAAILAIPLSVIPYWYHMIEAIEGKVDLESQIVHHQLMSDIENTAKVMLPISSSAVNLARVLSSTLQGDEFSFPFIETVYILAFPNRELENTVHETSKTALVLLIVMLVTTVFTLIAFVCIVGITKWRELRVCSVLIKQMDATQQAERKSINKSLAYASATHDVRAALGGIISLIEADYKEVTPGSELDKNMKLAASCSKDLLGKDCSPFL